MDVQVLYDKVASLNHEEDIIGFLESQGVRGYPESVTSCALAQYFKRGENVFDVVVSDSVRINSGDPCEKEFPLTPTMIKFIKNFDLGYYRTITADSDY